MRRLDAILSLGLAMRCAIGGVFMGLANLVPGISGGTMLLATGVYPEFVDSIAAITSLRWRLRVWVVAVCVAVPAVLAIGLCAGVVRDLVLDQRWIAYSLFIGLTLGGVPMLWRLVRPLRGGSMVACCVALAAMGVLVIAQDAMPAARDGGGGFIGLFIAAFAGAAAMLLPGVSGGYVLLLLGQYVPVLDAISTFTEAARAGDASALASASLPILVIGVGVVLGVVVVSNVVRWLLHRHRAVTLGALLGLLLGAVLGLWPFREPVPPAPGSWINGVLVESSAAALEIPTRHWPTRAFNPSGGQLFAAVGLVVLGFGICWGVGRLGAEPASDKPSADAPAS